MERFGAPEVAMPRDGSSVAQEPCGLLLSDAELASLSLRQPGRQRELLGVQECTWRTPDREELSLYVDSRRDLLVDTYRTRRSGFFVPRDIEGMPAVRQKSGSGDINICTVTTGLGPSQALEATWVGTSASRPGLDACEFAEQATALVVRKLPPAG